MKTLKNPEKITRAKFRKFRETGSAFENPGKNLKWKIPGFFFLSLGIFIPGIRVFFSLGILIPEIRDFS